MQERPLRVRFGAVVALSVALLATGCSESVTGTASAPRTVATTATVAPGSSAPGSSAPGTFPSRAPSTAPTAIGLPADGEFTYVKTRSGRTRCQISRSTVGCQVVFNGFEAHTESGLLANGVIVNREGELTFIQGNIGLSSFRTLGYRTYRTRGWTIKATFNGTTFTNDGTGHGMFVAVQDVRNF